MHFIKIPVYVIQKIHEKVRAKLRKEKGQSISAWVREKEAEELKK